MNTLEKESNLGPSDTSEGQEDTKTETKSASLRTVKKGDHEWLTTKWELWAFYAYYIVRSLTFSGSVRHTDR